jgi:hypothetical protein
VVDVDEFNVIPQDAAQRERVTGVPEEPEVNNTVFEREQSPATRYTRRRRSRISRQGESVDRSLDWVDDPILNHTVVAKEEEDFSLRQLRRRKSRGFTERYSNGNSSVYGYRYVDAGPTRRRVLPWYLRPLLVLLPFLRDWGGFL